MHYHDKRPRAYSFIKACSQLIYLLTNLNSWPKFRNKLILFRSLKSNNQMLITNIKYLTLFLVYNISIGPKSDKNLKVSLNLIYSTKKNFILRTLLNT